MNSKKSLIHVGLLFVFLVLTSSSCNETTPQNPLGSTLKVNFVLTHNGLPMDWNDVVDIPNNVNEYRMDLIKFYISNIKLMKADGSLTPLEDVILVDFTKPEKTSFSFQAPAGNYDRLVVGVGLDSALNASDPVTFPADHPLSANNSMYWTWGTQYRFVLIDGRANENGMIGNSDDVLIAYHPGASEFYSTRELPILMSLQDDQLTTATISVEVLDFFDGTGGHIDIPSEPQTHTTPSDYQIAVKFIKNFGDALSIK